MMLSSYLTRSRHGIFYFRWPIPPSLERKRASVRISLRTRCPDRAGDLARYLASCGRLLRDRKALTRLRQDEIRALVQQYFRSSLEKYLERMNDTGFSQQSLEAVRQELSVQENAVEGEDLLADMYLDRNSFCETSGLDSLQWDENLPSLRKEWRKGRRDMLRHVLEAAERLEYYSYDEAPPHVAQVAPAPAVPASSPLGAAVDDFISEHARQWTLKTTGQNRAYLNILIEYFGPERHLGTITKQDASAVKKVLQDPAGLPRFCR